MSGFFSGLFGNDTEDENTNNNAENNNNTDNSTESNNNTKSNNNTENNANTKNNNNTENNANTQNNRNTDSNANNNTESRSSENQKLTLHQEELDINKNKVQTGEVTLRKEIVEENKTVEVPVTREEVVIERRFLNNEASDAQITSGETIRIPVSEEQVQVGKHTVATGEVTAYKREIQETQTVNEALKREEARIDKSGNSNAASGESSGNLQ